MRMKELVIIRLMFRSSKWRARWRLWISSSLGCRHVPGDGVDTGTGANCFVGVLGRFTRDADMVGKTDGRESRWRLNIIRSAIGTGGKDRDADLGNSPQ
jgi:hypothetical protein